MPGGAAAAGAGRARPPYTLVDAGVPRYGVYSLYPGPIHNLQRQTTLHQKVSESVFSSVSAFGVPTPPPGSPFHLDLNTFTHQVLLQQKREGSSKMDDPKLAKQCMSDTVGCCGLANDAQRQMLENVTSIMQPLTIKTENIKRSCNTCVTASPKKGLQGMDTGCSRTNPVAWTLGVAGQSVQVQVKREPQHMQMSDLVAVKLEQSSPGNNKHDNTHAIPASLNNGTIPVGIAVARQRVGDAGLLAALSSQKDQQRMHDIEAAAMTVGVAPVGGALLHCDERQTNQVGAWPVTSHAPQAPPPTLWQYPAQMSMDSMMMSGMGGMGAVGGVGTLGGMAGVGQMNVGGMAGGFQLVRDPTSGALLLLPTPAEQYPQTVVWGGCPYPAPLLIPPQAPQPQQLLLGSCGDLLTSATLHQHTQTHSTRLVALPAPAHSAADKRKPMLNLLAPHALIKIEAEPEKPQYTPEPPLLYYQPPPPAPPPFLQVPQQDMCRSQATSPPAACLTPPPDTRPAHRDASNQTDVQPDEDDDSPNHADDDDSNVACVGVANSAISDSEEHEPTPAVISAQSEGLAPIPEQVTVVPPPEFSPEEETPAIEIPVVVSEELSDNNSSSMGSHDLIIDSGRESPISHKSVPSGVDVSGLELLSNSIEQFETARNISAADMPALDPLPLTVDTKAANPIVIKTSPKSPPRTVDLHRRRFDFPPLITPPEENKNATKPIPPTSASFDGLGLLCALAEQRFMEEVEEGISSNPAPPRLKIKTEVFQSPPSKRERRKTRDGITPDRSERKRHRGEDRHRYKSEKIRRRETVDQDVLESYRRIAGDSRVPPDFVSAIERDMRDRLADLQRQFDEKRAQINALEPCAPSPTSSQSPSSPLGYSSSKKRKVGRPKKVSSPDSTETIFAKKPKSKSSLVGYLLAAKSRLNMPNKGGIIYSKGEDPSRARTSKVRPKLKAEPKVKEYSEEDDTEWGIHSSLARSASSSMESLHEVRLKNREKTDRIALKLGQSGMSELEFATRRLSNDSSNSTKKKPTGTSSVQPTGSQQEKKAESRCTLTEVALDGSPRVLTARGGLFYAGRLSAVQAPDVYAINLDGERGNKPHILSREETLKDAILEVTPTSSRELPPGTRLCAYWSQQYRCLYPGTVADPASDSEPDDKFVSVEFDDGDSGRIAVEDIRLLEPDYPVVEYDPNPLLTLGKRRRNTSINSSEDKKSCLPSTSTEIPKSTISDAAIPDYKVERSQSEEDKHRDRKKLKKMKKEKLKRLMSGDLEDNPEGLDYIKKKKKKHKCYDEHCKHRRHHKKHHRKHRKRHHSSCKEHSSSSGDDHHRHKSSSDSNKSNEDSRDSNDQISTLVAMEKSPAEDMKTVIKKTVVSKKSLMKSAILDFNKKENEFKDNLKDSGICLEVDSVTPIEKKKSKKRTVSSTSSETGAGVGVSKMAAFLPGGALWSWQGAAYKRVTAKPRQRKLFYRAIQRGDEVIEVGDSAVFLSTGRPDRPYIGRIESLWEARGAAMAVKVRWFYHPEETVGFDNKLKYPGGLFESPHTDENDVQTISHKCEVVPLRDYQERMGEDMQRYASVYDNNDLYYLVGHYDPTQQTIKMQPDIPLEET